MESRLALAPLNTQNPVHDSKIVILYEDRTSEARAKDVAAYVAAELYPDYELNTVTWDIAALRDPLFGELAVDETRDADIVIISLHDGRALNPPLRAWLRSWMARCSGAHTALVALFDRATPDTELARTHLRHAAKSAGMDFLTQSVQLDGEADDERPSRRSELHWIM